MKKYSAQAGGGGGGEADRLSQSYALLLPA